LRPEASTRSNILCLFGQGNLIFIGEKSGDFEKYCLWQPWVWFPPTSRFLLCVCSLLQTPMRCPCVPLCVNLSEPFALPQGFPSHASAVGPPPPPNVSSSIVYFSSIVRCRLHIVYIFRVRYAVPVRSGVSSCCFSGINDVSYLKRFASYDGLRISYFRVAPTSVSKRVLVHSLSSP